MIRIVVKRLLALPLVLFGVALLTFTLAELSPWDPVRAYVGYENNVSQQNREQIAEAWGLDEPAHERFFAWLSNIVQGDLGTSHLLGGAPISEAIASRARASMLLIGSSLALVMVGGLLFGVLAAAFRDTPLDWCVRLACYFNVSSPSFWVALIAIYVFSITLGWLPSGGTQDLGAVETSGIDISYMILPVITLALTQHAWFTMYVRNTLLEVAKEDHVRFARANGMSEARVLLNYALPGALGPFVTLAGVNLGELIGGAVLIESIFGWPGLGLLARDAALGVDIPLLLAITLLGAVFVIVGNLVSDLLYRVLDPRVREVMG